MLKRQKKLQFGTEFIVTAIHKKLFRSSFLINNFITTSMLKGKFDKIVCALTVKNTMLYLTIKGTIKSGTLNGA